MNILHISPDFNYACGVSMHVYLLLKELSQRKELNIFFITNKGDSVDRLKGLNVRVDYIDFMRGNKNPYKLLKELILFYKYCSANKINLIHTHHRYPELIAYILSKIINVNTISTIHSMVEGWKHLSFKSHKIIAVSKEVEKRIINQYNVPRQKVFQLYNYVGPFDTQDVTTLKKTKEQVGIKECERILLFVGRINYVKGFDILMQVIEKIENHNEKILFMAVGDMSPEEFNNIYPTKKILNYYGPQIDLSRYYSIADIVVLPSRIDPFPFVMLETGLAKKPFIGGRTGGIEEFIEDGVDGLLVEPGNVDDLYNKIVYLLNNTELQKNSGKICSRRYLN